MCLEMVHRRTVSWLHQQSQDVSKCLDDLWFVIFVLSFFNPNGSLIGYPDAGCAFLNSSMDGHNRGGGASRSSAARAPASTRAGRRRP